jgi:hypothetical protein
VSAHFHIHVVGGCLQAKGEVLNADAWRVVVDVSTYRALCLAWHVQPPKPLFCRIACFFLLRSLSAAAGKLVCQLLHLPALTPAPLSMRQLMETQDGNSSSSSSREPVLFITTPGADPSQELAAYAEGQVRCMYMQQQQQQHCVVIRAAGSTEHRHNTLHSQTSIHFSWGLVLLCRLGASMYATMCILISNSKCSTCDCVQVGRERLHEVAMGQGQSEVALQLLRECAKTGEETFHVVDLWWLNIDVSISRACAASADSRQKRMAVLP